MFYVMVYCHRCCTIEYAVRSKYSDSTAARTASRAPRAAPGGAQVAWFKDPDGNALAIMGWRPAKA